MGKEPKDEETPGALMRFSNQAPFEYETAYLNLLRTAAHSIISKDPFVGAVPRKSTKHAGYLRNVHKNSTLDRRPERHEVDLMLSSRDLLELNISAHDKFVHSLAEAQLMYLTSSLTETMATATRFTERSLPREKSEFTWENYLLALERTSIAFDDQGLFDLPQIMVHPELAKQIQDMEFPPNFISEMDRIILKKREEWFASKRTRRLPGKNTD